MSKETLDWLSQNTLIGFTEKRGNAWHYRQGDDNHYPDAIPVGDVRTRLFDWKPISVPVTAMVPEQISADGVSAGYVITDTERQAIIRPPANGNPALILGVFKSGYVMHDYDEWLVGKVDTLLDGGLAVGSAGLLKRGAVAWVQIELPDSVTHDASGVVFRPKLTATTSLDGSLATTYVRGNDLVVCDNTLSAALGATDVLKIKVKHSKYSQAKIGAMRDALDLLAVQADEFGEVLDELTSDTVTDRELSAFLDAYVPIKDASGETLKGRSLTMATNKRDGLQHLWNFDTRVSPWKGTAFGVLQMANTFEQHEGIIRGAMGRAERNAMAFLTGAVDKLDASVLDTLSKVRAGV